MLLAPVRSSTRLRIMAVTNASSTRNRWRVPESPGILSGVAVAIVSVAIVTAIIYPVKTVAPAVSAGVIYLLAVLLVSTIWGAWLGIFTAMLSALAFNWFHIPPTGRLTIGDAQNWVALIVFVVTAIVVSSISDVSRTRALQADRRRREADLASELARLFSSAPPENAADQAAAMIADALELRGAQIVLGRFANEGPAMRVLRHDGVPIAALRFDGELDAEARRTLEEAVIPALEALIAAALEREALTKSLVEKEALRRSNEIKTSLLRAVSHDLRTPLMAISAAGEALQSPSVGADDRAALAASVSEQAARLSSLVSKLLDLSRVQAGELEPRRDWCAVDELVQTAIDQCGQPNRVELNVEDELPLVRADGALLERAFANLIDNALRYSGGEPVAVTLRRAPGHVRARVIDRGPGIDPSELETVFEPFQRGTAGERVLGGAGLGLAIVRGMVEANDGKVWAESLPGQGTTFVVDLPAEPVPAAATAPQVVEQ